MLRERNRARIQFFFTCEAEVDDLASLTGRLGYSWERALFYVKGGLAVGRGYGYNVIQPKQVDHHATKPWRGRAPVNS